MALNDLYHILSKVQGETYSDKYLFAQPGSIKAKLACINQKFMVWQYFMPLRANQTVLIFESLLGLEGISIAPHVNKTIILCPNIQIANIVRYRFAKYRYKKNILILVSSMTELPFRKNSIDHVIINEYPPPLSEVTTAKDLNKIMATLANITKPSSSILFGMKNGSSALWNITSFFKDIKRSFKALNYKHIIRKHFPVVSNSFCCLPAHLNFDEIITRKWQSQRMPLSSTLNDYIKNFIITHLFPFGSPNIKLLIKKETSRETFSILELFINQFCSRNNISPESFKVRHIFSGNPSTMVCIADHGTAGLVFRIPINEIALFRIKRQLDTLTYLQKKLSGTLTSTIPTIWKPLKISNQYCFVEKKIAGVIIETPGPKNFIAENNALRWLIAFQHATEKTNCDTDLLVMRPLKSILSLIKSSEEKKILLLIIEQINEYFSTAELKSVCMHGDFKIENMAFSTSNYEVNGVFDWDLSCLEGLPLIDLIYFIVYNEQLKDRSLSFPIILIKKFLEGNLKTHENQLLNIYLKEFSINKGQLFFWTVITWMYHILYRVHRWQLDREQFYQENVRHFLLNIPPFIPKHQ